MVQRRGRQGNAGRWDAAGGVCHFANPHPPWPTPNPLQTNNYSHQFANGGPHVLDWHHPRAKRMGKRGNLTPAAPRLNLAGRDPPPQGEVTGFGSL